MSIARLELSTPAVPLPKPPEELSIGTPSTTKSGELEPLIDVLPRILMFEDAPGEPDELTTDTPATLELRAFTMLVSRAFTMSSASTFCTEYPNALLFCSIPTAVTTISESCCTSSDMATSITDLAPISIASVVNPTKEKTRLPPSEGTDSLKLPSTSVMVPFVVP